MTMRIVHLHLRCSLFTDRLTFTSKTDAGYLKLPAKRCYQPTNRENTTSRKPHTPFVSGSPVSGHSPLAGRQYVPKTQSHITASANVLVRFGNSSRLLSVNLPFSEGSDHCIKPPLRLRRDHIQFSCPMAPSPETLAPAHFE